MKVHHFCHTDEPTEPTPLVTPPQSSDDEEVMIMILMFTDFHLELEVILKMCGVVCYVNLQDVCTYPSPVASPPHTLGAVGTGSSSPREQPLHSSFQSPRKQSHHPSFSALEGPTMLSCHLPPYVNTEHAQSWPSINVSRKQYWGLHEAIKRFPADPTGSLLQLKRSPTEAQNPSVTSVNLICLTCWRLCLYNLCMGKKCKLL